MDISFVIPAYNEEKMLPACLAAIKKQQGNFSYEIIVVDNNSTDRTAEIAKNYDVQLIKETQQGVGAARRAGTATAQNELIINLDADSHLPADFLLQVEKIFSHDKKLACLGARGKFYEVPNWKNYILSCVHYILYPLAFLISRGTLGPMGYCLIFKNADYKKTSGFRADLKYGEDGVLSKELAKLGKVRLSLKLICFVSDRRYRSFNHPLRVYLLNFLAMCLLGRPWKNVLTK